MTPSEKIELHLLAAMGYIDYAIYKAQVIKLELGDQAYKALVVDLTIAKRTLKQHLAVIEKNKFLTTNTVVGDKKPKQ